MTLDAAEVMQITEIATRVAAEVTRNAWRGTGGATMPIPLVRPGTVGGAADAGTEVQVRADGDSVAVPAINATGAALEPGDRVLIQWSAPSGVHAVALLSRASRGPWILLNNGAGNNNTNASSQAFYTRQGHRVTVYGRYTLGSGGSFGTGASFGTLPFPVISDGYTLPAILNGYYTETGGVSRPLMWVIGEGATSGQVWWHNAFGAGAVRLDPVTTTAPVAQAAGAAITLHGTYDTDAA